MSAIETPDVKASKQSIQRSTRLQCPIPKKEPDDSVSGDDPMTGAQSSYLKTLSEELGEREAFAMDVSKAEASKRIDALKAKRDAKRNR
jgi:hypothetical protein